MKNPQKEAFQMIIMKKIIPLLALLTIIFSCSAEKTDPSDNYDGKWKLMRVFSNFSSDKNGNEPKYEEFYILKIDSSFTKTRILQGETLTESGTYRISEKPPAIGGGSKMVTVELTYDGNSAIIANCTTSFTEILYLKSNVILMSTWQACDGPTLEYRKVE